MNRYFVGLCAGLRGESDRYDPSNQTEASGFSDGCAIRRALDKDGVGKVSETLALAIDFYEMDREQAASEMSRLREKMDRARAILLGSEEIP